MGSGVSSDTHAPDPKEQALLQALTERGLTLSSSELHDLKAHAPHIFDLAADETSTRVDACLDLLSKDPLHGSNPSEICALLYDESIEGFEVASAEDTARILRNVEAVDGEETETKAGPVKLTFMDTAFVGTVDRGLRYLIVSLDLSNCHMRALPTKMPFVRELVLSGCAFETATTVSLNFRVMPFLLVLDLSYVDLSETNGVLRSICSISTLVKLTLDGCCLDEMPPLERLHGLTSLSLMENSITSFGVAAHSLLEVIDLRENEEFQSNDKSPGGMLREAQERFPRVKLVNNHIVNTMAKPVKYADIEGLRDEFARTDTVADENEDRGSCSCLEGEPCAVEYTCKDWANRFKIAEYARQSSK